MIGKLLMLKPPVRLMLVLALVYIIAVWWMTAMRVVPGQSLVYVIEPMLALIIAGVAWWYTRGHRNRVRHQTEKALVVGSVIAVWFVAYFASGIILTYQYNAVAASWIAIVMNLIAFGTVAGSLEYLRYSILLLAGRRNVVWLGVLVSFLFAVLQMSIIQISSIGSAVDAIKLLVSHIIPAITSSFLLTYLAIVSGLRAQLTYRLGFLVCLLVPPIIPKYDWYLTGIMSLLLSAVIYIATDRTRKDIAKPGQHYHHARRASNAMFVITMLGLVMFMTGFFSYKPQVILSDSMKPVYARGAMVIVQKASPMDVQPGDIVQYDTAGHSITHRVLRIDFSDDGSGRRVFITKGDNSPSEDQPVQAQQIVGIIRAEIPYIGYPSVWLKELAK